MHYDDPRLGPLVRSTEARLARYRAAANGDITFIREVCEPIEQWLLDAREGRLALIRPGRMPSRATP